MAMNLPDMGKQVGPLPLGAWVAVVGGSFAFMLYQRNKSSSDPAPVNLDNAEAASIGSVGVGGVGAFTPTDGGVATPADATDTISSNTQWGQKAFAYLTGQGNDGSTVDKAVRDYLSGVALSVQENALITQALSKFGQAPEGLPDAPPLPIVPTPTPAPTPAVVQAPAPVYVQPAPVYVPPAPPPPPQARTVTVRPGDSLSKIAARFWEPWITWQSIYNANRGVIGGNPNLIRPGQVLVIA